MGNETDSATCRGDLKTACYWTASGPHSDEAALEHTRAEGHLTTLHQWQTTASTQTKRELGLS